MGLRNLISKAPRAEENKSIFELAKELEATTTAFLARCADGNVWTYPEMIEVFAKDVSRIKNHYFKEVGELRGNTR